MSRLAAGLPQANPEPAAKAAAETAPYEWEEMPATADLNLGGLPGLDVLDERRLDIPDLAPLQPEAPATEPAPRTKPAKTTAPQADSWASESLLESYRPSFGERVGAALKTAAHYAGTIAHDLAIGTAVPMIPIAFYECLINTGPSLGDKGLMWMAAGAGIGALTGLIRAPFIAEHRRH